MLGAQRAASAWQSEGRASEPGAGSCRLALPYRVISKASEFERVLRVPARWRTEHFALHHCEPTRLPGASGRTAGESAERLPSARTADLSTGLAPIVATLVEDSDAVTPWLGLVVPKRYAKRAVTRSLLKRRMRMAFAAADGLRSGCWVFRLKAPFPVSAYPSARSQKLDEAVRAELRQLIAAAQRPSR